MSESDDGPGRREVAQRVFAAEYEDATRSYQESDEERAPSYVVTPSGAKANRLFLVGVLTEVERVNEEMVRARVVDPTGAFVVYAGQYQPDERTFFERAQPPEFVAVTGKARTFQPEDSDRVFSSVRPESVNAVDADTRDRWVVGAAERTIERVGEAAAALRAGADADPQAAGLDPDSGVALALDHYDTSGAYLAALRDLALDAVRVVAGVRDEVRPLATDPDAAGEADLDRLAALGGEDGAGEAVAAAAEPAGAPDSGTAGGSAVDRATTADDGEGDEEPTADERTETTADADEESAGSDSVGLEDEDVGDFEPGGLEADAGNGSEAAEARDGTTATETGEDPGDAGTAEATPGDTDEMYELDEDERREVEEEFGTDFETGTEVDDPGSAGIDTPDPDASEPEPEATEPEAASGEPEDESAQAEPDPGEPDAESGEEETEPGEVEDVDLEDAVMEHMRDLDEGTGADREALVESVADATGADRDSIEDAIQEALMGGQCYEPDDETLKPI